MEFTSEITVKLIDFMGGDLSVVRAARVSTTGLEAVDAVESAGLINYLMKQRHGSVFEHCAFTFFCHAPIFVWREWHRHRIGFSYNEESARYKKLDAVFYIPPANRNMVPVEGFKPARPQFQPATPEQYSESVGRLQAAYSTAYRQYESLLEDGLSREIARNVLPVAIYSACWVTCNARSLMSFLSLRTHDPNAAKVSYPQYEIEVAARKVEELFSYRMPITHSSFVLNGRQGP